MKLSASSFLGRFYDVIDCNTNKKLEKIFYTDDKLGHFKSYEYHQGFKNLGIKIDTVDYLEFFQKGNIKLVGKNLFFKLLKKVIDKIQK